MHETGSIVRVKQDANNTNVFVTTQKSSPPLQRKPDVQSVTKNNVRLAIANGSYVYLK